MTGHSNVSSPWPGSIRSSCAGGSAEKGHRHDDEVRYIEARNLAETDATAALALLNQKPGTTSQAMIQELADRFAETDARKALRFADEAASQSQGLNQPDRTREMTRASAVLVKLGRADLGRKLIEDARGTPQSYALRGQKEAAALRPPGFSRRTTSIVPVELVEPFKVKFPHWWQSNLVNIAIAIARTDPRSTMELVDTAGATPLDCDHH